MIRNTFVLLERISTRTEQSLWEQGILRWDDFLKAKNIKKISAQKKPYYDRCLRQAQEALLNDESAFFVGKLPLKEMWRLYPEFKEECGFLDIETDSVGKITLVGVSNYFTTNQFVRGVNLENELVERELSKYKIVVTFNGGAFDLPKLRKQLGVEIKVPHIDLKPLCVKLGLKGGLKEVERILELKRPAHLYGNPVELWNAFHASGDREYLELLLQYNAEDIENLKGVIEYCYKELRNKIYKPQPLT